MIVEQWVAEAHTARLVGDCGGAPPPPAAHAKPWQPGALSRQHGLWFFEWCAVEPAPRNLCTQEVCLVQA
jgi:hypothetical protein